MKKILELQGEAEMIDFKGEGLGGLAIVVGGVEGCAMLVSSSS